MPDGIFLQVPFRNDAAKINISEKNYDIKKRYYGFF